jgi:hypothetical protein
MFGRKERKERQALEAAARDRIEEKQREEQIEIEVQRQKRIQEQKLSAQQHIIAAQQQKAAENAKAFDDFCKSDRGKAFNAGLGTLFICVFVSFVSFIIGGYMSQWVVWILTVSAAAIAFYNRGWLHLTPRIFITAAFAFIMSCSASIVHDTAYNDAVAQATRDAAAQTKHNHEVQANHIRRLAWNLSHPAEAAAQKAALRARLLAENERQVTERKRQERERTLAEAEANRKRDETEQHKQRSYAAANAELVATFGPSDASYYNRFEKIDGKPVLIINGDLYYGETEQYAGTLALDLRGKIRDVAKNIWEKYSEEGLSYRVDCLMAACEKSRNATWGGV